MNLVIVNENTIVVNALTIDIIKVLNGVYDVNSIEKELVNFYFNKVIIDITAIKNYFSSFDLFEFLNYFGKDKVILLLNDSAYCNSKEFLTQLINNGYYNFTSNSQGVSFLVNRSNTYEDVKKYGVVDPKNIDGNLIKIKGMVEKPQVEDAPSNYAVLGRYVLTNKVFDYLAKIVTDGKKEIQLTTGIEDLLNAEDVYAYCFEGIRYDIGDKFGYIKATIDFALNRDDLKDKVMEYIKKIAK